MAKAAEIKYLFPGSIRAIGYPRTQPSQPPVSISEDWITMVNFREYYILDESGP